MDGQGFTFKLVATAAVGGAASVAGGGKFENGAVTAAYGYLFNQAVEALRDMPASPPGVDINGNIDEALCHKGMKRI